MRHRVRNPTFGEECEDDSGDPAEQKRLPDADARSRRINEWREPDPRKKIK